jgi:thymidylate synthase
MNEYLEEYLAFLRSIVDDGKPGKNPECISLGVYKLQIKLNQQENKEISNFPLLSSPKVDFEAVCKAVLSMIEKALTSDSAQNPDESEAQMRQKTLRKVIDLIINKPKDCSMIFNDPESTGASYHFTVSNGALNLFVRREDDDVIDAVPSEIAKAALFLCLMAHVTGRAAGTLYLFFVNPHIRKQEYERLKKQFGETSVAGS